MQPSQNNSEYVSIDSSILDGLLDSLSCSEKQKLIHSYTKIMLSIKNGSGNYSSQQGDSQQFLDELEKIIPHYQPLLRESLDRFNDETYITTNEFAELHAHSDTSLKYEPKLLIDGGDMEYAFLQGAASMAGIADDNLYLWYGGLRFLFFNSLHEIVH